MKNKKNLVIILAVAAVILPLGVFIGLKIYDAHKLSEFRKMVAAIEVPESRMFLVNPDGTVSITAPSSSSIAILSEDSVPASLYKAAIDSNVIHVLFMPVDTPDMRERVFSAFRNGLDIHCLFVPGNTDDAFMDEVRTLSESCECVRVKKDSYYLFGDCAVYFHGSNKEDLTFSLEHANNSFLYSYSKKVGSLLSKREVDVVIMPYDTLLSSNILCEYALLREEEVDVAALSDKAYQYLSDASSYNIYCYTNGAELYFDVSFNATGRLEGQ